MHSKLRIVSDLLFLKNEKRAFSIFEFKSIFNEIVQYICFRIEGHFFDFFLLISITHVADR